MAKKGIMMSYITECMSHEETSIIYDAMYSKVHGGANGKDNHS